MSSGIRPTMSSNIIAGPSTSSTTGETRQFMSKPLQSTSTKASDGNDNRTTLNAGQILRQQTAIGGGSIKINKKRQEGNPIIKFIRNVPYEYSYIKPDYECGKTCAVLYLSLKYHKRNQNYIETRLADGTGYGVKVLLVHVDVDETMNLLKDLNLSCFRIGWTLILCYSEEEAAEYLENLKIVENKTPEEFLNKREEYKQKMQQQQNPERRFPTQTKQAKAYDAAIKFLSSIRSVTTSDAKRLITSFGSIKNVSLATTSDLQSCPGLGPVKADNVYNFFRSQMRKK